MQRQIQRQFMEDLSVKFPEQMEETRLKVRRDVRRSLAAAKHLVAAQVCFVLAMFLVKQSLSHFTPSGFMASRALVSIPFILALAKSDPDGGYDELKRSGQEFITSWYVLLLGALVFLGQLLLYLGLERVSVANTAVLGQLVPVYSCTIAVFQGVEKPSWGKFVAIGAGVLGAAVMLDPAQMWLSQGNLFLLARSAVFAAYLALQAPILQAYLPVTVAAASQLVGASISIAVGIPLALHVGGLRAALGSLQNGPIMAWTSVIGVAALSAAAYTLTARAVRHTTPVVAACYNTLQPVVALAVMTWLGEGPPEARNLLGSGLILLGGLAAVALSTNDRRRWKERVAAETAATTGGVGGGAGVGDGVGLGVGGVGVVMGLEEEEEEEEEEDGGNGGTVIRNRGGGGGGGTAGGPSGTVRMVKFPGSISTRRRPKLGTMVWTVVWALVMSLCALAGGGFLTWSLVYLYWKYLC